ncbi:MAG: 3-dehydroquinate synthase, partial [Clostridia bacterium]
MKNILSDVITRCVSHKRDIVERDELDTGVRMTLNFGHTIGHAVERHGKYSTFTHGNAVAIGMVASARIGEHLSLTASGTADKIAALLKRFNLPTELPCRLHELLEYIMIDKKTRDGYLNMILLTDIGHCTVRRTNLHELKELCEVF